MARVMKRAAEAILAPIATVLGRRRTASRETLILAWHNIVPHGRVIAGEASLHMPQRMFAAQLDALCATHDVIPLDAVRSPAAGSRPRAVITFDDGYRGALTAGLEELERRKLPATFFVTPAFVPGGSFWWDEAAVAGGGLAPELRQRAIEAFAGRHRDIRRAMGIRSSGEILPAHAHAGDLTELARAATVPGISLASHTWSHVNLARVSEADVWQELTETKRWLAEQFRSTIDWISFPYGRSSEVCERLARECGYGGALRIDGGWVRSDQRAAFVLPRLNVPSGFSVNGFRLRTAGWLNS